MGKSFSGTLTPGALADITVLEYQDRPCGLGDRGPTGSRIMRAQGRLINQITILGGAVRFDYDGHTKDDWSEAPEIDTSRRVWMFPQANPPPLSPPPSPQYSRQE